uniref:Uncharacterized protein n=1 Tax=Oryza punctata TaxID=4537 RepID=A0A0E0JPF5_ORYPU
MGRLANSATFFLDQQLGSSHLSHLGPDMIHSHRAVILDLHPILYVKCKLTCVNGETVNGQHDLLCHWIAWDCITWLNLQCPLHFK